MIRRFSALKPIRFIFIVLAVLIAQGCGSRVLYPDSLKESPSLSKDEGVAMVSVTFNHWRVKAFQSIEFTNVENKRRVVANGSNVARGMSEDTSLFVVRLPAGEYVVSRTSGGGSALEFHKHFLRKFPDQRKFVVRPGEMTDLGRIVITQMGAKQLIGYSEIYPHNKELLKSRFPFYYRLVGRKRSHGWETPEKAKKGAIEKLAIGFPAKINDLVELRSGHIIAASNMGGILLRYPKGKWKLFSHTGDLSNNLAVASYENKDSLLVAGGEFGSFVKVDRKGKVKRLRRGNLPEGNIVFIHHNENYSDWYIVLETTKEVERKYILSTRTIYRSNNIESGVWKKIESFGNISGLGSRKERKEEFRIFPKTQFFRLENGFGALSLKDKNVTCFHFRNNLRTRYPTPDLDEGMATRFSFGYGGAAGISRWRDENFYTEDCGKNWIETAAPDNDDPLTAPYLLPSGNLIQRALNIWNGDNILWFSTEQGKKGSWQEQSVNQLAGYPFFSSEKAGLFWLFQSSTNVNGTSSILRSTDEGKTWIREYDFTLPDLKKE